jgi:hypothetical protein
LLAQTRLAEEGMDMARGATGYRIILTFVASAPMALIAVAQAPAVVPSPPAPVFETVRANADVIDLYGRVQFGAKVVVPPSRSAALPRQKKPAPTETSTPQPDKRSKRSVAFAIY